jgi:hypothetical protein
VLVGALLASNSSIFLPQIHQIVARSLESHADVANLALSSRQLNNAILADHALWKQLFLAYFDAPFKSMGFDYRTSLIMRTKVLREVVKFTDGRTERECDTLWLLRELILGQSHKS